MGLTKKVNLNNIIWYGIYWFATFGLCLYGSIYYVYNDNSYLILGAVGAIAKGTAESLKFQGALAMLLMCRSIIFKLCVSFKGKLTQYTPLDNTLKGHIYGKLTQYTPLDNTLKGHIYVGFCLSYRQFSEIRNSSTR
eukprot:Awhi_evm2s12180